MHTYSERACSECGDMDGCHIPGKVKRSKPLNIRTVIVDGCMGQQECESANVPIPPNMARHGQAYPKVVCLCGSTRFGDAYKEAVKSETLEGNIVLSVGMLGHAEGIDMGGPLKAMLDELHKRKIDMADEVLVLNVGGYVGSSTRGEIEHALKTGKKVRYLEQP